VSSSACEPSIGRWSRLGAREFVRWLDVGCGTGALVAAILAGACPLAVTGVDRSATLPIADDGAIRLTARAWAARGRVAG